MAGIAAGRVDAVVAGANGSRGGDRAEAMALRAAWGDEPLPPLLVPKGVTGEYGGGHLAAAVLAVAGGDLDWPAAGFRHADPALGVVPFSAAAAAAVPAPRVVLASALAAGGAAAALVLERP